MAMRSPGPSVTKSHVSSEQREPEAQLGLGLLSAGPRKDRTGVDRRRRSCFFCKEKIAAVDYKNIMQLRRFISERGKIKGRGNTGTCRKHQSQVAVSIKRAREMALLPYVGDSREPQTRPRSRYAG
jgi:small subunit ribosomal protein S18